MSKFQQHFFVCVNARPPFAKPSCGPRNANELLITLQEEIEKRGLAQQVKVTGCSCLGPCEDGPIMVVYPAGIWYAKVSAEDVNDIIETQIIQGKPVARLVYNWPEEN